MSISVTSISISFNDRSIHGTAVPLSYRSEGGTFSSHLYRQIDIHELRLGALDVSFLPILQHLVMSNYSNRIFSLDFLICLDLGLLNGA